MDETERIAAIRRQTVEDVSFYIAAGRVVPPRVVDICLLIAEIDRLTRLCATRRV